MDEHYITKSEFALLLLVSIAPLFFLAAIAQWRILVNAGVKNFRISVILLAAVIFEFILSFAIWLSPIHKLFLLSNSFPSFLEFAIIPIQACLIAVMLTSILIWLKWRNKNAL